LLSPHVDVMVPCVFMLPFCDIVVAGVRRPGDLMMIDPIG
jgi:hypothetical protein